MKHAIFALEVCMRLEQGSGLRDSLKRIVLSHPEISGPGPKWEMFDEIRKLLLANTHLIELGCWDYFDTDVRALKDYDMWSKGMTTEEGARLTPSGGGDPYRQGPRYMTFTVALLLMAETESEYALRSACNVPDSLLWRRKTFVEIIGNLARVNFAFVKSDVVYLIPGEESWGLTDHDLQAEKFEYLRRVTDS